MGSVRVRFAPSPTGYLHVGGARTALYNWLFARRHGGTFVLRIEDTDVDRSKPELVEAIVESLAWLGLKWDEGPYRQSERLEHYRQVAEELERRGHAYPCFCTSEELQAKRARSEAEHRPWKYDGTCRRLSPEERARRRAGNRPAVLRFQVPEAGETAFEDQVFGQITVAHRDLEDFVLLRSDGHPTYHLGVVVDDLDMRITHVIRGADHLSNTPKQVLLYRALETSSPAFAHLPLLLGPDRQRLSKRHGATSVGAYRDLGILPDALVNFLALLGWTPPGGKEIVPLEDMVQAFDLAALSKSNAVFDTEKLAWMNGEYLRRLPADRLLALVEQELKAAHLWRAEFADEERERFRRSVLLLQSRARTLKDYSQSACAFFSEDFDYDPKAVKKFWNAPHLTDSLEELARRLSQADSFDLEQTEKCLRALAAERGMKAGELINGARVALTGQAVSPGLFELMVVLGRERVANRLRRAVDHLRALARPPEPSGRRGAGPPANVG